MPQVRASQLVGKTIRLNKQAPFYRVFDINNLGDRAKPVSNMLPVGYQFVVDTFITSGPAYTSSYGVKYAARKNDYLTFFGKDKEYYAIKVQDISVGAKGLKEAGVKTVKQEEKEEQEAAQTPLDKLFTGFGKFANFAKYLTIGIAAVWATGYIIKQTKK